MSAIMSKLLETVLEDLETETDSRKGEIKSRKPKRKSSKSKANENGTRTRKKSIMCISENGQATNAEFKNETTTRVACKNKVSVDVHVPRADHIDERGHIVENSHSEIQTNNALTNGNCIERTETPNSEITNEAEPACKTNVPTRDNKCNSPQNVHKTNATGREIKDRTKMDYSDLQRSLSRAHSAMSSSFYSTASEPIFKTPNNAKRKSRFKRPKTAAGLTKRDLEIFLPRKNFFNSHDKVLRDAGYNVDNNERAKNKPNWRAILRMHTDEELNPERHIQPKDEPDAKGRLRHVSEDTYDDDYVGQLNENIETNMAAEKDSMHAARRRLRIGIKLLGANDRAEYKPLYDYLKYIHDNPEEYVSMARYTSENTDYKHPSVLVRTARVFSRGHNYDVPRSVSIFTHAINNLKPKFTEPARGDKITESAEQASRVANLEEGKTEIERMKIKTEKWMRGLTTQQLLRTKDLALKDLGEEDINVTKWWTTFKSCNYLRVPSSMIEIG